MGKAVIFIDVKSSILHIKESAKFVKKYDVAKNILCFIYKCKLFCSLLNLIYFPFCYYRYLCIMETLNIFNVDDDLSDDLLEGVKGHSGFSSSARGTMSNAINLNRELSSHPESTYYARVEGDAMRDVGVNDGDLLVVDMSIDFRDGDLAVCILNGEFLVRFIERHSDTLQLVAAHPDVPPVVIGEEDEFEVWGVVTYTIHKMRGWSRKGK